MLPSDLRQAEAQLREALKGTLNGKGDGRWMIELRFEGLKLLPLALRLAEALEGEGIPLRLLFPDAGATALARRRSARAGAPDLQSGRSPSPAGTGGARAP